MAEIDAGASAKICKHLRGSSGSPAFSLHCMGQDVLWTGLLQGATRARQ